MRKQEIKIDKRLIPRTTTSASTRKISIDQIEITHLVKSLTGVIKLPKNFDYKKDYAEYLFKKYDSLK